MTSLLTLSVGLNFIQLSVIVLLWKKVSRLEKAVAYYIDKEDKRKHLEK